MHTPAYSEISLMLTFTPLSWQTPLKYGRKFPASENAQTSKFKAEDTSSSFLRNVGTCQCYNVMSHNTVIQIFTVVWAAYLIHKEQFVYCI
jgi:hypothetical protein